MYVVYIFFGGCALYVFLFMLFELHYFTRTFIALVLAKISRKNVHILEETTVNGLCVTTDIDGLLTHMNNARFIRELDFAKIDFYERTGLYRNIRSNNGSVALGATTIRYRRFIKLFHRYQLTTKIIYWDEKNIFMEHRFITPSDKFVNAIVLCKIRLINCNAEKIMADLLNSNCTNIEEGRTEKPELPVELAKWNESNDISSAILRNTIKPV